MSETSAPERPALRSGRTSLANLTPWLRQLQMPLAVSAPPTFDGIYDDNDAAAAEYSRLNDAAVLARFHRTCRYADDTAQVAA